jgi:hypothetical protein
MPSEMNVQNYPCRGYCGDVMCSQSFSRSANARRHIKTGLSKRCPDCLLSFDSATALVEHATEGHYAGATFQICDEWLQAHTTWVNSILRAWTNGNWRPHLDPVFVAAASSSSPSTPWDARALESLRSGATADTGSDAPVQGWHFVPGSLLLTYSDGEKFTICLDLSQQTRFLL